MKTCHIFCAAEFEGLLERPAPGDWILAADGGLRHLQALALEPTGILGDFDSLGYTPQGPQVDRFPVEKDDTDSMLAVKAGLRAGFRRFLLYGALDGPRLDHTVANFQLLHYLTDQDAHGYLVGSAYLATVLAPGLLRFSREARGILSVFCSERTLPESPSGACSTPWRMPCSPRVPLGVSNHFLGCPAQVSLTHGRLLLLWDRSNGLPERRITG
ncbi:MAG: thiamine diphosphokinase [Oscillospiraceae bacterium]